jgi:hypothetical protein
LKVVFATPSLSGPTAPYIKSLEQSIPLITAAGWEEGYVQELQNPYISAARSIMTRKALDAKADVIVYLDYDLSWDAKDLLTLLETDGDVVAGTYRYKKSEEEYMGEIISNAQGTPLLRPDGCIKTNWVPAGFLKVTKKAIQRFMRAYPGLLYGEPDSPSVDLFNHGAHEGVWYGEDVAFCRNWRATGGEVWLVPNLNINHHTKEEVFKGNIHEFLLRQPGGSKFKEPE